jgi:hypothetical protein
LRRARKVVAITALSEPWEEGGGETCLEAVQAVDWEPATPPSEAEAGR